MKAVRFAPPSVAVTEIGAPPEAGGVLVAVRSVSICGSDLSYLRRGSTRIAGHEIAGTTPDGTAVVVNAVAGCGRCPHCRQDRGNLCARAGLDILGLTVDGGLAEFFRVPARRLIPLPPGLRVEDASIVEPGAVAWHACAAAPIGPGQRVAVVGGGAIGQLAVLAAAALGAGEIALEARHPYQQELAGRFGAAVPEGQYDVVIEAAGSESALARAMELARPRGTVATVGVYPGGIAWPYREAFRKEIRTVPSMGYTAGELHAVAGMLAARPDAVDALITHRFGIGDAAGAFAVAARRAPGTVKVVVHP
jgi:2-desacetyl-2-hydroxyethyl bacteriochlorophyllide A dehydrogenase